MVWRAGGLFVGAGTAIPGQLEEARHAMVGDAALVVDLETVEAVRPGIAGRRLAGRGIPMRVVFCGFGLIATLKSRASDSLLSLELLDSLLEAGSVRERGVSTDG